MEGETSWVSHCFNDVASADVASADVASADVASADVEDPDSLSDLSDENNTTQLTNLSLDLLPNDLLERIIANLPITSIFKASSVSKRWYSIVTSPTFLWNLSNSYTYNKPWYFMFTSSDEPIGYTYDPILKKWYSIDLPCIGSSNWFKASSCGLVCFMDSDTQTNLYVCNPITRHYKSLEPPPGFRSLSDYSALAISVNRFSRIYNVTLVKSRQVPGNFFQWDLSIHVYDSVMMTWRTRKNEILTNWRGGDESVICDGVLYFLIYATGGGGYRNRHSLIAYNLSTRSNTSLVNDPISVPCSLTCGRLMNLKENLVLVGGIGKIDRPDIIKGIGIWILRDEKKWEEIGRMPYKYFQGFGELDDVFASCGSDDYIYIQSYGSPLLLVFDSRLKSWKWSQKCPVTKRFPLQLFSGFCFEPRLEIAP